MKINESNKYLVNDLVGSGRKKPDDMRNISPSPINRDAFATQIERLRLKIAATRRENTAAASGNYARDLLRQLANQYPQVFQVLCQLTYSKSLQSFSKYANWLYNVVFSLTGGGHEQRRTSY